MKISVIGLGKLGTSTAFFLRSKGLHVSGYDINKETCKLLEKNKISFYEKSLEKLLKRYKIKVHFDLKKLIQNSDTSYIIVPTPSKKDGSFSYKYVKDVLNSTFQIVKNKKKIHNIILTSTVSPKTCETLISYFEKKYNIRDGKHFRFFYNPYFIALGDIVDNLDNPDFLLVGCKSKNKLFYRKLFKKIYFKKKIPIKFLNITEAEITKISINCYITMKISYTNTISSIADNIKSTKINTAKILDVIGSDKRINKQYLKLGTMFSGPCFPRDNLAMTNFMLKLNSNSDIFRSSNVINNYQSDRYLKLLSKYSKNKKIGFLGLTYKSGTDLFTDSPAFYLYQRFKSKFKVFHGYDPFFKDEIIERINNKYKKLFVQKNYKKFVSSCDIIILCYQDQKFKKLKNEKNKIIVDPWNYLKSVSKSKYINIGIS
tara:strand:+ start:424 stop:1710 length:1287 start_codon:yes stop_codon:yes gene_type:complete